MTCAADFVGKVFADKVFMADDPPDMRKFLIDLIHERDKEWERSIKDGGVRIGAAQPQAVKHALLEFRREWARGSYDTAMEAARFFEDQRKRAINAAKQFEPHMLVGLKVLEDGTCVPEDEK